MIAVTVVCGNPQCERKVEWYPTVTGSISLNVLTRLLRLNWFVSGLDDEAYCSQECMLAEFDEG